MSDLVHSHANLESPNSLRDSSRCKRGTQSIGAKSGEHRTEYFQAPARQLTPQANLRVLPAKGQRNQEIPLSQSEVRTVPRVVVATTVALAFISFLRAASIVLSDLASSAFYAGGIAERAIGRSAPWFVLAVMLFSFAVR